MTSEFTQNCDERELERAKNLLGRTLARIELVELQRSHLLARATAFGLPFRQQAVAASRAVASGKIVEDLRDRVRRARAQVEAWRRKLQMYDPPPPFFSEARARAAREVVADLMEEADRELAEKKLKSSKSVLQNEPRDRAAAVEPQDDLDWGVA